MIEQLVDSRWAQIRFSLDGPNAEINDYIRSRGFDKAVANMKRFSELKRERGVEEPDLAFYVTVTNLTYDKVEEFVELAHATGPDVGVELSGLIVEEKGTAQFELTPEQKEAYPDFVRKGIARAEELGVYTNFERYLNEELVHDGMDMHRDFAHSMSGGVVSSMCLEPYTSMSILPDGRVGPCCAFYDEHANSLKDLSLEEVWNGAYMTEVRAGMQNGNPPSYCDRCPSNMYVQKERVRQTFVTHYKKLYAWDNMGPAQRLRYVAARGLTSLREVGVRETLNRSVNWARLRAEMGGSRQET